MNEMIDEQELQRLLDGSLSSETRHLILKQAEENPSNWRVIALAFVEEQVLSAELGGQIPQRNIGRVEISHSPQDARVQDTRTKWNHWLANAVVIALTLGTGLVVGRASMSAVDNTLIGNPNPDNYTVVVTRTAEEEQPHALRHALFTPLLDEDSRQVISDHGYKAIEKPVLYIVQGKSGEQYVVPHHKLFLLPQSQQ